MDENVYLHFKYMNLKVEFMFKSLPQNFSDFFAKNGIKMRKMSEVQCDMLQF